MVMVGQWAGDDNLIATDAFEKELVKGWTRGKKRKALDNADDDRHQKVIVVDE